MGAHEELDKTVGLDSLQLTGMVDEDLLALISCLIDQNAELMQKIQGLNSHKELANSLVREAHEQEETTRLSVEKEARDFALGIIREAETKTKIEADKILAEARIEADRILTEAKQEAQETIEQKNQFAIQQGLLIINKAQERAFSILKEVQKQAEEINGKANQKGRV